MSDAEFLQWIHDRLEKTHGENPDIDYMIRLRQCIKAAGNANSRAKEIRKYIAGIKVDLKMIGAMV